MVWKQVKGWAIAWLACTSTYRFLWHGLPVHLPIGAQCGLPVQLPIGCCIAWVTRQMSGCGPVYVLIYWPLQHGQSVYLCNFGACAMAFLCNIYYGLTLMPPTLTVFGLVTHSSPPPTNKYVTNPKSICIGAGEVDWKLAHEDQHKNKIPDWTYLLVALAYARVVVQCRYHPSACSHPSVS